MSKISQEYDRSASLSKEILRYMFKIDIVGKECKRRKSLSFAQTSMYLCSSPRVQANMEAILFVLVSWPFWCSRKCRVTVPWAASASNVLPSEDNCNFIVVIRILRKPRTKCMMNTNSNFDTNQHRGHESQGTKSCKEWNYI